MKDGNNAKVLFTGAKRDLLVYRKNRKDTKILKGDLKPVGGNMSIRNKREFTETEVELSKGDILYLTTDGFIDQNNKEGKRFGST